MKKSMYLFLVLLMLPVLVSAEVESNDGSVTDNDSVESVKYYKTTTSTFDLSSGSDTTISTTEVVSEKEYNQASTSSGVELASNPSTSIETTYKKMTATISKSGSYYQYKVVLDWKNIPKTRSYDTIAIGFYSTVKIKGTLDFIHYYCEDDDCGEVTSYPHSYSGSNGIGVTFHLPTGTLTELKQTLYFKVQKNTSSTIYRQKIYGDYAHAQKSITLTKAKDYVVSQTGIILGSTAEDYYDSIDEADVTWTGSW